MCFEVVSEIDVWGWAGSFCMYLGIYFLLV